METVLMIALIAAIVVVAALIAMPLPPKHEPVPIRIRKDEETMRRTPRR